MDDERKIQFLHKTMAVSGFLFALCILPVVQYALVSSRQPAGIVAVGQEEAGTVAGVSTDTGLDSGDAALLEEQAANEGVPPVIRYANIEQCQTQKETELADLERWVNGKKIALVRDYEEAAKPYNDEIKATADAQQKADIAAVRDQLEYTPYLQKLTEVQNAVDAQKAAIQARQCQ